MQNINAPEVDFSNACLHNTEFYRADLSGADLSKADLEGANFDKAKYCIDEECKTIFPDGFDPKSHKMISVDINGKPISEV